MTKEESITFVLLSDLHFGVDPFDEGENCFGSTAAMAMDSSNDPHFQKIVRSLCTAHDYTLFDQLPQCIRGLAYEEGVAAYQRRTGSRHYEKYKFDQFIFLGDLVTYPIRPAFRLVAEFIEGRLSLRASFRNEFDEMSKRKPLALGSEFLMIPGNHDKLFRPDLAEYYRDLCFPLGYPARPEARGSHLESRNFQGQEFLFISLDANIYLEDGKNPILDKSHFAQGRISPMMHEELRKKFASLRKGHRIDDAEVTNWSTAFKILLVHYAVDEKKVLGRFPHLRHYFPPLGCELLRELVDCSGGNIDLVLHGHLHKAKLYSQNGIPVVSVPTCTQMGGNQGFYILRFFHNKKLELEHYRWNKTGFRLDKNPVLSGVWTNQSWAHRLPN